ncbi:MAG: HAD family hydrolase [Chlamydiota bacterium]
MLIIFDLDDTLIDTSGCITYHKLEEALLSMQKEGLQLEDFQASLELLRRLDSAAGSARDAISEFVEIVGADPRFAAVGIKEVYHGSLPDLPIVSLKGVQETLFELSLQHQLALVSNGRPEIQLLKLKKAGIDSRIFSKIAVADERCKRERYQSIVEELGYSPSQVIVCGDRVSIDLVPGRELGFKTVHVQWGRGLNASAVFCDVDYSISEIADLKSIVGGLKTFSTF